MSLLFLSFSLVLLYPKLPSMVNTMPQVCLKRDFQKIDFTFPLKYSKLILTLLHYATLIKLYIYGTRSFRFIIGRKGNTP